MGNLDRVKDIMEKMILDEERRKLDRVKREKLKQLKERARHFEPFVPKITSAYHVKKQSSVSVLQSFTSAVQSLCSPEKSTSNGYKRNNADHFQQRKAKLSHKLVIPSKSVKSQGMAQCIDLCSSDEEDNEVQIRFR